MEKLKEQIGTIIAGVLISVSIVFVGIKTNNTLNKKQTIGKYQSTSDGKVLDTETGYVFEFGLKIYGDTIYLEPQIPKEIINIYE